MKITRTDALFISFCAGFGEEILFRTGMQHYLGILITSIFFVAIHGYLNPFNWRYSLYGLIVLPFILLLLLDEQNLTKRDKIHYPDKKINR